MAREDCKFCRALLQRITDTAMRRQRALEKLQAVVRDDPEDVRIASLKRLLIAISEERQDALDRYRLHAVVHEEKVLATG